MKDNGQEFSRREERHRRRVRNQILVYVTTVIAIALVVIGIVMAALKVANVVRSRQEAAQLAEQQQQETEQESQEIVISEPEPMEEEPQEERDALDDVVDTCIDAMSLEDKVAGLFIITPEQLTGVGTAVKAGEATQTALNDHAIGGLVYRTANIKSADQFSTMLSTTATMSRYPIFLAVVEEGEEGTVAKSAISVTDVKTFAELAASGDSSTARSAGSEMGGYLSELGINVNLAPSANLDGKTNSFGTDSTQASSYVGAFVEGLEGSQVSACLKTFPGIVATDEDHTDTEQGMASIQSDTDQLRAQEFPVFQAGIDAGADFCMISNVSAPNVTGDNTPCVLSATVVTDLLRGELGFKGIVITDDFTDAAITEYYTAGEAAVKAIRAGVDMIYMPENFEDAYAGVLEAVNTGALTEDQIDQSLHRIYRVKYATRLNDSQ